MRQNRFLRRCCACCVLFSLVSGRLVAETTTLEASFDRWNYPFNASPGSRLTGSTFGAVGNASFDDHDAQIILGFDTSLLGNPDDILVQSLSVTLTTSTDETFVYDPTFDSLGSYLDPQVDGDAGRPVELYGVGFRNGFAFPAFGPTVPGPISFEEGEAFVFGNPASERVRNAFASDFGDGARDISNRVSDNIETTPWAVGAIEGLAPGDPVPLHSEMRFDIDLDNVAVLDYVHEGLASGGLFFTVASLHASTQGSSLGIPAFFLGDAKLPDLNLSVARLDIDYRAVPEPESQFAAVVGVIALMVVGRWRS